MTLFKYSMSPRDSHQQKRANATETMKNAIPMRGNKAGSNGEPVTDVNGGFPSPKVAKVDAVAKMVQRQVKLSPIDINTLLIRNMVNTPVKTTRPSIS